MERDEIYLVDMWRILLREWKWFLAVLFIVLAITFAFSRTARRQWEASAWILIGQVGQVPPGQDPKAEPLARVIERLQTVPFQNEVMHSIGFTPDTPVTQLYRKSLKLEPLPYAGPMIRLSVRGASPQQARQLAEATVSQLRAIHRELESTPLALAHKRLDEVQIDLTDAVAERTRLMQAASKEDAAGKNGQGASLAGVLVTSKSEEIRNLQVLKNDLFTRLSDAYTYDTSLPWPVYVPEGPAFPNPLMTWGVGLLAGFGLGAFAATARNAVRRQP
jgi:uncharacterized protein involved in exopolysaccharide biosynthesis